MLGQLFGVAQDEKNIGTRERSLWAKKNKNFSFLQAPDFICETFNYKLYHVDEGGSAGSKTGQYPSGVTLKP
jgi:hypothetical protein